MEKIAYKPLRHAPRLSPLISAIGMSLFLQNYVMLAQTPDFLPFPALIPEFAFMEPVAHIAGSAELVILVTSAALMIGLTVLIRHTRIGKAMRATQQDLAMARLVVKRTHDASTSCSACASKSAAMYAGFKDFAHSHSTVMFVQVRVLAASAVPHWSVGVTAFGPRPRRPHLLVGASARTVEREDMRCMKGVTCTLNSSISLTVL